MKRIIVFTIIMLATCKVFALSGGLTLEILSKDAHKEYVYYLGGEEIAREKIDLEGNILLKSGRVPDGEVKHFSKGRVKEIWNFKNNKRNGIHREYFENGKVKFEGTYKDDVLTGKIKSFNNNGTIKAEGSFGKNGFTGTIYTYNDNSLLEIAETYKNGEIFRTREYFKNEKLKNEWSWKNGFFHGICRTFYKSGKIASLDTYEKGQMIRREVWDDSGNLKFCRTYTEGGSQNHVHSGRERREREKTNAKNVHEINQQQLIKENNINLHK
jgi:antitoxin component YwqK of YwqJK toxin-antitoxin module